MYICYIYFNYSANIVYAQLNKPSKSSFNSSRPVQAPEEPVYDLQAPALPERSNSVDLLGNGSKPSSTGPLSSLRLQSSANAPTSLSKENLLPKEETPTNPSSVDCTMVDNELYASSMV